MMIPALQRGGYRYRKHVDIGQRLGRGRHVVDVLAEDSAGRAYLVSVKWQQVSGTAEQKVPFEVICLAEAMMSGAGKYEKAYLVLGGPGWSLRDFFVGGGLSRHLTQAHLVHITALEDFIARANAGSL
jgi:hypothetical protein